MTRPARSTQAELARSVRALASVGVPVNRVGIYHYPDGRVVVQAVGETPKQAPASEARGWGDLTGGE